MDMICRVVFLFSKLLGFRWHLGGAAKALCRIQGPQHCYMDDGTAKLLQPLLGGIVSEASMTMRTNICRDQCTQLLF
jgi:hypothetical protein